MRYVKIRRGTVRRLMFAAIMLVSIIGVGVISYFAAGRLIGVELKSAVGRLEEEKENAGRYVYMASAEIKQGEIVSADRVTKKRIFSTEPQSIYADDTLLGCAALVDIAEGMSIRVCELYRGEPVCNQREFRCSEVILPDTVKTHDYCDVRLLYPDGTSYIVLSKKRVLDISEARTEFSVYMNEEELLLYEAATVDAFRYAGSSFVITRYINAAIQPASIINYTPSSATLELIGSNPNIAEIASDYLSEQARAEVESRLESYYRGYQPEDTWRMDYD